MAVDFENSQTKKNLEAAFAGESQACVKYGFYAKQACDSRGSEGCRCR